MRVLTAAVVVIQRGAQLLLRLIVKVFRRREHLGLVDEARILVLCHPCHLVLLRKVSVHLWWNRQQLLAFHLRMSDPVLGSL